MSDTQSVVSANVERLLDGRTQVWLARKLGVANMYIHRRMRGRAQWSADDLRRLSEALVTSPDELLSEVVPEPVREAGHVDAVLAVCLGVALLVVLSAALPGPALAVVAGGALVLLCGVVVWLSAVVGTVLRDLDDHP